MTRIIALVNQKGGVGKTTCTINIGAGLSAQLKRVLLLDLDPQGNMTAGLGIDAATLPATIYETLKGECAPQDAIITNTYDILPADIRLSAADMELANVPGREFLLKETLSVFTNYDYILIDCPPSLSLLTLNALTAASEIFIPLQAEFYALHGMSQLLKTIEAVQKRLNHTLSITGIIITLFDSRKKLNREVMDKIQEHFPDRMFKTPIRNAVALAEAPGHRQNIFCYRPDSNGALDFQMLCNEIIQQEQ